MTGSREMPLLVAVVSALLALGCGGARTTAASPAASPPASPPAVERPATPEDLRILERADQILSDSTRWDRADDRVCSPSDTTWSLFCAIQQATAEVLGAYRHEDRIGQAATREVRRVIQDLNPGRRFEHRLMDYNNLPTTSFDDIKRVLRLARERVAAQLAGPSR